MERTGRSLMPRANDGRETKVGEAGTAAIVDEYVCLIVVVRVVTSCRLSTEPYPFQVSVHHVEAVHVF